MKAQFDFAHIAYCQISKGSVLGRDALCCRPCVAVWIILKIKEGYISEYGNPRNPVVKRKLHEAGALLRDFPRGRGNIRHVQSDWSGSPLNPLVDLRQVDHHGHLAGPIPKDVHFMYECVHRPVVFDINA